MYQNVYKLGLPFSFNEWDKDYWQWSFTKGYYILTNKASNNSKVKKITEKCKVSS